MNDLRCAIAIAFSCGILAVVAAGATAFAQGGSTGGVIGKTDKSASGAAHSRATRRGIAIRSATYGGNCGAASGNMTRRMASACNGKRRCTYVIDYQVIGDPAPMCAKNYVAEWGCGDEHAHHASIAPEAGYRSTISLNCD